MSSANQASIQDQVSTSHRRRCNLYNEIVPAVLVDYSVDKQFQTQVGTIHHARERGCRIHGTQGIAILPGEEQFWSQSRPVLVRDSELDGKQVPTYFGEPTEPLIQNIRNGTAQRLSRRVRYQGGNNQAYEKLCEVNPDDVDVQTKQMLFIWPMENRFSSWPQTIRGPLGRRCG